MKYIFVLIYLTFSTFSKAGANNLTNSFDITETKVQHILYQDSANFCIHFRLLIALSKKSVKKKIDYSNDSSYTVKFWPNDNPNNSRNFSNATPYLDSQKIW